MAFSNVLAQVGFHDRGTLVCGGSAWDVWTTYVSANFFSVLGTVPAQGRGFLPEEDRPGSAPVGGSELSILATDGQRSEPRR